MKLPDFFKPLVWSYDFSCMDTDAHKKTIIVNAINYGDLRHWRWIAEYYGKEAVGRILASIPASELRPRVQKLAGILFALPQFNHAPRSAHPKQ